MHVLIVSDVFVPVSNLSLCTSNQDSGQIVVVYLKSSCRCFGRYRKKSLWETQKIHKFYPCKFYPCKSFLRILRPLTRINGGKNGCKLTRIRRNGGIVLRVFFLFGIIWPEDFMVPERWHRAAVMFPHRLCWGPLALPPPPPPISLRSPFCTSPSPSPSLRPPFFTLPALLSTLRSLRSALRVLSVVGF